MLTCFLGRITPVLHARKSYILRAMTVPCAFFFLASCQNIQESQFEEGMQAYAQGDVATAIEKWRPMAESGNPSAQTNLGVLYYQGRAGTPKYQEALKWYRLAAMQGYPDAQFNLGLAYMEGKGVSYDMTQALRWYNMAAEGQYLPAQLILADIHLKGQGVNVDHGEAVKWYRMAAEQGSPVAQYVLGNLYLSGQGTDQDLVLAYKWFMVTGLGENETARQNAEVSKGILRERMTEAQISEAETLARQWAVRRGLEFQP
jgi:hypothetical protein